MGVINVNNVSKMYKLYKNSTERFKEAINPFHKEYGKPFYALDDVSFEINKGEMVGIIGANGSGKSTILKIITGVVQATTGSVEIDGRIAALLELGAGFDMEYTGIENIYMNGAVLGFTRAEMDKKVKDILEFADIGEFAYQPVKTYSSGMFVRLAFAAQIFSDPDILVIDEALSVGDIRFQQKCYRAMDTLMKDKTVIIVTHDTAAVTRFCKRVIWLNKGKKVYDGDVVEGLSLFQEYLINQAIDNQDDVQQFIDKSRSIKVLDDKLSVSKIPDITGITKPKGNGDAIITRAGIINEKGNVVNVLEPYKTVSFVFAVEYKKLVERPILGMEIFDRLGNVIFSTNTEMIGVQLPEAEGMVRYDFSIDIPPLNDGEYTISPGLANGFQDSHVQLCWIDDAITFRVPQREYDIPGFFYLDKGKIEAHKIEDNR